MPKFIYVLLIGVTIILINILPSNIVLPTGICNPINDYEKTYPICDYVSEDLDQFFFIRNNITKGLVDSEKILSIDNNFGRMMFIVGEVFNFKYNVGKIIKSNQYKEVERVSLTKISDDFFGYQYKGVLDGHELEGLIAINGDLNNTTIAVSFEDSEDVLRTNNILYFIDDSNSELLAYFIIEELQTIYETNMDPNDFSMMVFNCTLEELAGSISYHAIATYILNEKNISEDALIHASEVNIGTIDSDGKFVNHPY